jgi:SAM-dependent methyltransferase
MPKCTHSRSRHVAMTVKRECGVRDWFNRPSTGRSMVEGPGESKALATEELERIRLARQKPRIFQFDYLHLRVLRDDIARELAAMPGPVDVLDVYCGTRPYEQLLPAGARCTGLDVTARYGAADVVTDEFLPFEDGSFDLVVSFEGFHYVPDPAAGIREVERVLRPGGRALVTVPLTWEYERGTLEHRFTGPELERLFAGWEDVRVSENGGRGVAWAAQTGRIIERFQQRVHRRLGWAADLLAPAFALVYVLVNLTGAVIEKAEDEGPTTLPMNLMVIARRP